MRITLEATREIVEVAVPWMTSGPGVPCRVWRGKTDAGVPMRALVALVGVERTEDQGPFERELEEKFPTADAPRVFPARLVL